MTSPSESFGKKAFLTRIDQAWNDLQSDIATIPRDVLTGLRDAAGWTAKDHLAHLEAWERSMLFLMQGKPRHLGLGVDEDVYNTHDVDLINDAIYQTVKDESLADVLGSFAGVHARFREVLDATPEVDFLQPYKHFLSEEPGTDDGQPIHRRISHNLDEHFAEHRGYIHTIVRSGD